MARRIREYDWASHPFGSPDAWPQSLRSALSICLHSAFPTAIYWGPELRLLYNDAWAPIPGPRHPGALGAPARQVWSDIWHIIEPQFSHVLKTGEGLFVEDQMLPMRRFGAPEETYWSYSFTAIRGEDGAIAGVFNSGSETSDKVLGQRQMAFLLELGEAFRSSPDSRSARHTALKMLGEFIEVDRVGFRELEHGSSDRLAIVDEWTAPRVVSVGSSVQIGDLGVGVAERLSRGRSLRINDVHLDGLAEEARPIFDQLGVRAVVAVPWVEDGKTVAVVFLHSRQPRHWNDFEVSTAEKVLERTVLWMERERAAEKEKIMMREIDHRAQNALAVVQSVIRLTRADDLATFREKIEDRVAALGRCHSLLSARRWEPIDLRALFEEELAPYAGSDAPRVLVSGPMVMLQPEKAQTAALLIHELTTNAAKYGGLSVPEGGLDISWERRADKILQINWSESVPDRKAQSPAEGRAGFGSVLLERVVTQLGGTFERSFETGALRCVVEIPIDTETP